MARRGFFFAFRNRSVSRASFRVGTRAELQFEIRRFASSCAYDHDDVARVERPNRASNQGSVDRRIHARYKPMPYTYCQGGDSNSRPRAYESPALPLSYPGKIIGGKGQTHEMDCQRDT